MLNMKILMVLTSHDTLGNTGRKTGFWLEELAAPYYAFLAANAEIVLASPKGATAQLANTVRLDSVSQDDFDAVFYPGGHGPLWDLAEDPKSIHLIEAFLAAGKPAALVCHAPGVLRHVKKPDGTPLVAGKKVAGFTNSEEEAVGLTNVVPFLVEDMLIANGGLYSKGADWSSYVVSDGLLITGQNPGSSTEAAQVLIAQLNSLNA
ncbi:unnamed protein product, partial [Mesorhabditis spiculigera]